MARKMAVCPVCFAEKDARGLAGHIQFSHPDYNSRTDKARILENIAGNLEKSSYLARIPENSDARNSEKISQISEKDALMAELAEQDKYIADLDMQIAALKEEIEYSKSLLDKVPQSLDDFPSEERAAYFVEFLKNLSPENKVKLAELTGFRVNLKTEAVPLAEVAQHGEGDVTRKMVIVFNGKGIGTLVSRG